MVTAFEYGSFFRTRLPDGIARRETIRLLVVPTTHYPCMPPRLDCGSPKAGVVDSQTL